MPDPLNYSYEVERVSPPWMRGKWGSKVLGTFALVANTASDLLSLALRSTWIAEPTSPDDAVHLVGRDRRLPKYPGESAPQYRARVHGAWDAYEAGGDESAIEGQLAAAGYPGAKVTFFLNEPGPHGEMPYRSQFWVVFPPGTHPVTRDGPEWNGFLWNDGTAWGPGGMTPEFAATIRGIVRKWKPVQWICRGFIFEFEGAKWNEFEWNDGSEWNGRIKVSF